MLAAWTGNEKLCGGGPHTIANPMSPWFTLLRAILRSYSETLPIPPSILRGIAVKFSDTQQVLQVGLWGLMMFKSNITQLTENSSVLSWADGLSDQVFV